MPDGGKGASGRARNLCALRWRVCSIGVCSSNQRGFVLLPSVSSYKLVFPPSTFTIEISCQPLRASGDRHEVSRILSLKLAQILTHCPASVSLMMNLIALVGVQSLRSAIWRHLAVLDKFPDGARQSNAGEIWPKLAGSFNYAPEMGFSNHHSSQMS